MKLAITCTGGNYVAPGYGVYGPYEDDDDILKLLPVNWAEEYGYGSDRHLSERPRIPLRREFAEYGYWEVTLRLSDDAPARTAADWRVKGETWLEWLDDETGAVSQDIDGWLIVDIKSPDVRYIEPISVTRHAL